MTLPVDSILPLHLCSRRPEPPMIGIEMAQDEAGTEQGEG